MKEYISQLVQQVDDTLANFEICECNIINDSLEIVYYLYDILIWCLKNI